MKNRALWKVLVLSIVTIGIYRLYWFIKTRREIMDLHPEIKIRSPYFLIIPIVIVIAAFVLLVGTIVASSAKNPTNCTDNTNTNSSSYFSDSQDLTQNSDNSNCPLSTTGVISLVVLYASFLIAYIFFVIWEWSYSHGVEAVTGNKLSFALSLIVLILVPDGIDILILQDYFNKVPVGGATPPPDHSHAPHQLPPAPVAS